MNDNRHKPQDYDDNARTKWWCQLGLIAAWFLGMAAAIVGGICLFFQLRDGNAVKFSASHTYKEVIPLALNFIVTVVNEAVGYIHTCSLRWALQADGKLKFSSNLRLFSSSKRFGPNYWIFNAFWIIGLLLSYSSTSLIFLTSNEQLAKVLHNGTDLDDPNGETIHINAMALITFGGGLLIEAIIGNWAFISNGIVSWSSNPLDVVRECQHPDLVNRIERRRGRCMMPVHLEKEDQMNLVALERQKPMISARGQVLAIFVLLWVLPVLGAIWGGIISIIIAKSNQVNMNGIQGKSWAFLPVITGNSTSDCSAAACTDGTSVFNIRWTAYSGGAPGAVGSIALITAFQAVVTLSLHCAELIVNLSRDEKVYRELISRHGTNAHYNSILAACTSWQTAFLFGCKALVHWMFGLAINTSFKLGVNMYPPQIFYFTVVTVVVALFGTYLAYERPKGPLPASYGHVQTIADVIDFWSEGSMFWGHKDDGLRRADPCYAGTASDPLDPPYKDRPYGGVPRRSHQEMGYHSGLEQGLRLGLQIGDSGTNVARPSYQSLHSAYSAQSNQSRAPLMQYQHP